MFSKKDNSQTLWVGLSFLVIGLTAGLLFNSGGSIFGGGENDSSDTVDVADQVDPSKLETVSVSVDNDPVMGEADAPITIVEFSDYQCPFCKSFYDDTLPTLIKDYVEEGIVKIVFRDFPLPPDKHPQATLAAEAAECVRAYTTGDPDESYFAMHDLLFTNQSSWSGQETAKDTMVALAKDELGVEILSCLDSGEMTAEVQADYVAGKSYGISGTPTFFINGKKLVGAWPYEVFEKVIEAIR